ncbi:MAG: hypothetical protein NT155_02490 [Candidatus Staskawiczbacteria bacterium]|nr:hypothetical protein [Candidatus Staskawiczbacteria bacterium]
MNKNKFIILSIFLAVVFISALAMPGVVDAQSYGCTNHYYGKCSGNNVYWYDSCGNQQELSQYCPNGCANGICQDNFNYNNNNYNYNVSGNCTYHAYKLCQGNNIYWYSSCNNQQDLYQACGGSQVCKYGQCVNYVQPVQPVQQPANNYTAYSTTICRGSSIYWLDSLGVISGSYKNCQDNNSCTIDTCLAKECSNLLKCDGSTCAVGSADYIAYCPQVNPVNVPVTVVPPVEQPATTKPIAAVSNSAATATESSGFWGFIKHWYGWIIATLILIVLFIIVYRRLSSEG